MRRSAEDRLLGGVAGGISARIGVETTVLRIALVLLGLISSGLAFAGYVLAWLFIAREGEQEPILKRATGDRRGIMVGVALIPALIVALVLAAVLGAGWLGSGAWALFVAGAGLVLVYRNAAEDERAAMRRVAEPLWRLSSNRQRSWFVFTRRIVLGAALMLIGLAFLVSGHHVNLARAFLGLVLIIAGLVIVFGPWWLSVGHELVDERQARARAEERADLAARVHDSVLQTLALIQRRADQPQQVIQLARAQERELRAMLFSDPGADAARDESFAAALRRIQQEVEASHGVPIEVVVVGDVPLDGRFAERLSALLAAGREASVNAAKWSGAPVISLFGEAEPERASLFVRDRGGGFDLAAVAADRKGLSESIRGRMSRCGGTAEIRTAPGEGTEVRLSVRLEADRHATRDRRAGTAP